MMTVFLDRFSTNMMSDHFFLTPFLYFQSYEWALEAMKVVGRVKGEGLASPEQVGSAARALSAYLEEHPPIADDTFTAMNTLATRLNNHTLLQQCKVS